MSGRSRTVSPRVSVTNEIRERTNADLFWRLICFKTRSINMESERGAPLRVLYRVVVRKTHKDMPPICYFRYFLTFPSPPDPDQILGWTSKHRFIYRCRQGQGSTAGTQKWACSLDNVDAYQIIAISFV